MMNKLKEANGFFRAGDYSSALNSYRNLLLGKVPSVLRPSIEFNVRLTAEEMGIAANFNIKQCHINKPDFLSEDIYQKVIDSGIFNKEYYYENYSEEIIETPNLLEHYLKIGLDKGFKCSIRFDPTAYIEHNPDVTAAKDGVFLHYVLNGQYEGRRAYDLCTESNIQQQIDARYINKKLASDVTSKLLFHTKIMALYLPQFHAIPENDEWWGKGFTEWTNVNRAESYYPGHYQPRVPDELGYYDLSTTEVQHKQIEYAKNYGIFGFCFYYYWFGGKRLLEKPVENYLDDKSLDHPYCLCWANENWTRRWDGKDQDLLIGQEHSPEDDINFIKDVSRHFQDDRYIKVDGKPLLIVYRPSLFPDIKATVKRWREWCLNNGIGEICLCLTLSFDKTNPEDIDFDMATEFPPNSNPPPAITGMIENLDSSFKGNIFDWTEQVRTSESYDTPDYPLIRGVNPSWDNTARKQKNSHILYGSSPRLYENWLVNAINDTKKRFDKEDRLVLVNAWNEWAEGAYLEPDSKYGFSYLEATRNALLRTTDIEDTEEYFDNDILAVVIHSFYPDVLEEIIEKITDIKDVDVKIYVTTPDDKYDENLSILEQSGLDFEVVSCANRGRDVLPFIHALERVFESRHKGLLKLHTKKSTHRQDGNVWRNDLYTKLLDSETMKRVTEVFKVNSEVGLVGPAGHSLKMEDFWGANEYTVSEIAMQVGISNAEISELNFFGGTMFYAKTSALVLLHQIIDETRFEAEIGQTDGTYAHAIERVLSVLMNAQGLKMLDTDLKEASSEIEYQFADIKKQ